MYPNSSVLQMNMATPAGVSVERERQIQRVWVGDDWGRGQVKTGVLGYQHPLIGIQNAVFETKDLLKSNFFGTFFGYS